MPAGVRGSTPSSLLLDEGHTSSSSSLALDGVGNPDTVLPPFSLPSRLSLDKDNNTSSTLEDGSADSRSSSSSSPLSFDGSKTTSIFSSSSLPHDEVGTPDITSSSSSSSLPHDEVGTPNITASSSSSSLPHDKVGTPNITSSSSLPHDEVGTPEITSSSSFLPHDEVGTPNITASTSSWIIDEVGASPSSLMPDIVDRMGMSSLSSSFDEAESMSPPSSTLDTMGNTDLTSSPSFTLDEGVGSPSPPSRMADELGHPSAGDPSVAADCLPPLYPSSTSGYKHKALFWITASNRQAISASLHTSSGLFPSSLRLEGSAPWLRRACITCVLGQHYNIPREPSPVLNVVIKYAK